MGQKIFINLFTNLHEKSVSIYYNLVKSSFICFQLINTAPPPPNTSHNKCEGTYEYIFQQGQVVIQYLDWDPSHVDLIYWAYACVCEDLCVCVRELEMSVCLWLEDVCKLKKKSRNLKEGKKN